MTTFRSDRIATGLALLAVAASAGTAGAQASVGAISLQPLPGGEQTVTVKNVYGRCGGAVVQVLGVSRDVGDSFLVDAAAGNADVVVIPKGAKPLHLRAFLSDSNGVACVGETRKRLLTWSACNGSACGDDFQFTVVDPDAGTIVAGGRTPCDAECAARASGSDLPKRLNR